MEVRIVDPETGQDLPTGEVGEIVARGFGMFEGYHDDPERTAEAIDPDGWFHTGDIGSVDDGGRIAYHGRTKDMLKVGGENVAALEIESYLSCIRPCASRRSWACPTTGSSRCRPRSSSSSPGSR